jgi:hypothetical protein
MVSTDGILGKEARILLKTKSLLLFIHWAIMPWIDVLHSQTSESSMGRRAQVLAWRP